MRPETFDKLRVQLELLEWPNVYFFKFIVPNKSVQIAEVTALFDSSAELVMHPSSKGTYMSISAKELMLDVDSIIEKYKKASTIEGITSL
jgi:putative lipoic acid-binding regulatory protein